MLWCLTFFASTVFLWGRWYGSVGLLKHDRGGDAAPTKFAGSIFMALDLKMYPAPFYCAAYFQWLVKA